MHLEKLFFIRKIVLSEEPQFRGSRIGMGDSRYFPCTLANPLYSDSSDFKVNTCVTMAQVKN